MTGRMILVDDVDNRDFLCELVRSMWEELPEKKREYSFNQTDDRERKVNTGE